MTTPSVTVTFNGVRFRRYPEAKQVSDRMYYKPGHADRLKGVQALHQEVWKHHHCRPIPEGFDVHHADHDSENNDPSNLVLMDSSEHKSHHANTPEHLEHMRTVYQPAGMEAARAWHATEEGREWHAAKARAEWEVRRETPRTYICEECGESFTATSIREPRFCSNNCKSADRRKSGVDDEDRTCLECGATFRVNKYAKKRYCSRKCGAAWRTRATPSD